MPTLVIETATAACSVALLEDRRILGQRHELVGRGHAERLLPMIAELLDGARADAILVDCGPGSFTGVRVGIAAARGLGLGWKVPVTGYSSLALIAAAAAVEEDVAEIDVAIGGGHGELFVQRFATSPFRPLGAMASLIPDAAGRLATADLVVGSAAEMLVAARGHGRAIGRLPRAADAMLLPAALATLPPSPIYGRAPDAKRPA